jgi:hypothetical protein
MRDRSLVGLGLVMLVALGFGACAQGREKNYIAAGSGTGNYAGSAGTGTGASAGAGAGGSGGVAPTGGGGTGHGGDGCIPGLTPCDNTCVDLLTNPQYCGNCETACDADRYCGVGNCLCSGGLEDCSGVCTNTQTDHDHCGGCDTPCAADRTCVTGGCMCANNLKDCGGVCVNQHTDHDHCGFLCLQCAADEQCVFGFCTCANPVCGVCPDYITDLGNTVPQTVNGSTSNGTDDHTPPCGNSSGGPDVTYQFTAPSAGSYTLSLCGGASFDTLLYVLNMSCSSLACDDDSCSPQSRLSVTLTAGEQVLIVVDGYDSNAYGAFTLTISSP